MSTEDLAAKALVAMTYRTSSPAHRAYLSQMQNSVPENRAVVVAPILFGANGDREFPVEWRKEERFAAAVQAANIWGIAQYGNREVRVQGSRSLASAVGRSMLASNASSSAINRFSQVLSAPDIETCVGLLESLIRMSKPVNFDIVALYYDLYDMYRDGGKTKTRWTRDFILNTTTKEES